MLNLGDLSRLREHRFPRTVIGYAVWAHHRFALILRNVEDLLAERKVIVSHEAIRVWATKFRAQIRRDELGPTDPWQLDEVVLKSDGAKPELMMINARQIPEHDPEMMLRAIDDIPQQEVMRRAKELAEVILDAAPLSFLILDHDLRVIRANKTFYDAFGVNRAETEGRLVYHLGNDQWNIPKLRVLLEDVLPDNETFVGFEVEHNFEEIGHRVMMLNARRINEHQLIMLAIDDLTETRAREREQAARRDFLLDLLDRQRGEMQPEAIVEMTCEALGRRLGADQVYYADVDDGGGDGHRILPQVWSNGRIPEWPEGLQVEDFGLPLLEQMKEGRTVVIEDVHQDVRTRAAGALASFDKAAVASLIDVPRVKNGRLRAIFGVHFSSPHKWPLADVRLTEEVAERLWEAVARCRAQAALRVSEERFSLVAKATSDVIWDEDMIAGTKWWNESLQSVFGYAPAQVEPGPEFWTSRIHAEDRERVLASLDAAVEGSASIWSEEYRFLHADGCPRTVVDRAFVIRNAEGRAIRMLGGIVDVTAERDMENRLRQAQRLEAVGQLTGGVAHDFNNLLTVILGSAGLLSEDPGDRKEVLALATMIATAAERGGELTRRLLAFSRKQALEPQLLDVNTLICGIEDLLRRTLAETIDIRVFHAEGLWKTEIDPSQLDSAILNLSLNARDAMPEGGRLTIETANATLDEDYTAREQDVVPGQYVMITVTDTGEGIAAGNLARVFEPFFTTKRIGKGSGLGLSMVYGFVKQSGGHISVYSEPGEGTAIRLYFPRAFGTGAQAEAPRTVTRIVGGNETILLVEDNTLVREYLIAQLKRLGYRVVDAACGPDAVERLQQTQQFDLLFTDVVMPGGMNGRQLADLARKTRPKMKILFTSGYTEQTILDRGRLDPGVELLSKPYRLEQLAAKLREVLDGG